jgi:hypothetical protein
MRAYDRLPAELREWLAGAVLPWRPASVRKAFERALAETGDRERALARLDALQDMLVGRDAAAIWGEDHPAAWGPTAPAHSRPRVAAPAAGGGSRQVHAGQPARPEPPVHRPRSAAPGNRTNGATNTR